MSEQCCKPHDRCYDAAQELYRIERNEAIEKCDVEFNECIWNKCYNDDKSFCRSWIFVTHGKLVQIVTKFCTWTGNVFCNGYWLISLLFQLSIKPQIPLKIQIFDSVFSNCCYKILVKITVIYSVLKCLLVNLPSLKKESFPKFMGLNSSATASEEESGI